MRHGKRGIVHLRSGVADSRERERERDRTDPEERMEKEKAKKREKKKKKKRGFQQQKRGWASGPGGDDRSRGLVALRVGVIASRRF